MYRGEEQQEIARLTAALQDAAESGKKLFASLKLVRNVCIGLVGALAVSWGSLWWATEKLSSQERATAFARIDAQTSYAILGEVLSAYETTQTAAQRCVDDLQESIEIASSLNRQLFGFERRGHREPGQPPPRRQGTWTITFPWPDASSQSETIEP